MQSRRPVTPHQPVTTLIAGHFDMGSGYGVYRPNGTDDYLLIYTVAGLGMVRSQDGRERTLGSGEVVLISPGSYQEYGVERSLEHWELLWTHFRPRSEWLDLLAWPAEWPGVMRLAATPKTEIETQFRQVLQLALRVDPLRDRLAMNALEGLLLRCEQLNPRCGGHHFDERLRLAINFLTQHLDRPITLESLAEQAGLSSSRLSHLFRSVVGVPPMQFLETQRITRAKQLLTMTSLSVKQIARLVGYDSPFYFSLRFKRATGSNPTAYRAAAVAGSAAIESSPATGRNSAVNHSPA